MKLPIPQWSCMRKLRIHAEVATFVYLVLGVNIPKMGETKKITSSKLGRRLIQCPGWEQTPKWSLLLCAIILIMSGWLWKRSILFDINKRRLQIVTWADHDVEQNVLKLSSACPVWISCGECRTFLGWCNSVSMYENAWWCFTNFTIPVCIFSYFSGYLSHPSLGALDGEKLRHGKRSFELPFKLTRKLIPAQCMELSTRLKSPSIHTSHSKS